MIDDDGPGIVDSHCHLADKAFAGDRPAVLRRAFEAGVKRVVAVGGGGPIEASEASADLAASNPCLRATAGIHPHDAANYDDAIEARIEALLARPEVSAVGETGLDYYYGHSSREDQKAALARHLSLARRYRKPVVLHCRDAEEDLRDVIDSECPEGLAGVVHCFTGDYPQAVACIDRGLLISFTGIITFKNADDLREVARRLPLDRLMVETDSPYLAPEPHRGKRNEPAFVTEVARVLADLRSESIDKVAEQTSANAEALFFS